MYTGPDIQDGMHVYDSANQRIGIIADVYPNLGDWETEEPKEAGPGAARMDEVAARPQEPEDSEAHRRAHAVPPENVPYFRLDEGGVLGIGAKHLYIPFDAIARVDMNEARLWLSCTKDEAAQRYASKPAFLERP
jgi:hypothetical protein